MSRRLVMGKLVDGTYGLRVSLPGFDANANPPVPSRLAFDSNWPALLPIHQSGTITFGNGVTTVAYPTLPVLPVCGLFLRQVNRNGSYAWPYPDLPSDGMVMASGYSGGDYLQCYLSVNTLTIQYVWNSNDYNSASWTLHYVIYKTGV